MEVSVVDWMTDLIERELCLDKGLSPSEKGLYIVIKTLRPNSIVELAQHAGLSHSSASRACANLAHRGWVRIEQVSREKRIWAVVPEAVQVRQAALLSTVYSMQPYKGEFLLKVLLDSHVLSHKYVDNARPKWLVNPTTEEQMEIDRLYLPEDDHADSGDGGRGGSQAVQTPGAAHAAHAAQAVQASWAAQTAQAAPPVQAAQAANAPQALQAPQGAHTEKTDDSHGFEFHGPQHFGPTKAYPDVEECKKTQSRDLMKKAICADNGVKLIVVTYRDLSPKGILKRIPKTLATGYVDYDGKYMTKVRELCANYRANARDLR